MPSPEGQALLSVMLQTDLSQWLDARVLEQRQYAQLRRLLRFAVARVPRYRGHLARANLAEVDEITPVSFTGWPMLTKADIRDAAADPDLHDRAARFGGAHEVTTSGSTGRPVTVVNSGSSVFFQHALMLRYQLWYGFDPLGKSAVIKASTPRAVQPDWGAPVNQAFRTGALVTNSAFEDHIAQLQWLKTEAPRHLLAHNTNLRALIEHSIRRGPLPDSLRVVIGFGDTAAPDLGMRIANHWKARYFDTYSCSEIGPLALQCPQHAHLHVQSEHVLVEILRPDGSSCGPGEIGRVVVTDLHNFAMPLIRYELGDQAAFGPPCPCGRGLPVLKIIAGRTSDLAVDPTGRTFFAHLNQGFWASVAPVLQRQIAQLAPDRLEIRYVAERDLTSDEMTHLRSEICTAMRYAYAIGFSRVAHIAPGPGGKFVDFVSMMHGAAAT